MHAADPALVRPPRLGPLVTLLVVDPDEDVLPRHQRLAEGFLLRQHGRPLFVGPVCLVRVLYTLVLVRPEEPRHPAARRVEVAARPARARGLAGDDVLVVVRVVADGRVELGAPGHGLDVRAGGGGIAVDVEDEVGVLAVVLELPRGVLLLVARDVPHVPRVDGLDAAAHVLHDPGAVLQDGLEQLPRLLGALVFFLPPAQDLTDDPPERIMEPLEMRRRGRDVLQVDAVLLREGGNVLEREPGLRGGGAC